MEPSESRPSSSPSEVSEPAPRVGVVRRTFEALGPVFGGVALDLLDLASFGPVGVFGGLAVGGLFAWWLTGVYRVPEGRRPWIALAAGVYCALPMTEALPLATVFSVISRLARHPRREA